MPKQTSRNDPAARERELRRHSETVIIPHITKEMLDTARRMANEGASRAEIEQAIAAMQSGGAAPAAPEAQRAGRTVRAARPAATHEELPPSAVPIRPTNRTERRAQDAAAAGAAQRTLRFDTTATRTVSLPKQRPAAEVPAGAAGAAAAAAGSAPAAPVQPARRPAKADSAKTDKAEKAAKRAPRTKHEAEAELEERIRSDHVFLSNPVMVRGLGLAPVVAMAVSGRYALMLCAACLVLITGTRVLAVAVCHLTGNRFRAAIYSYAAALLYIPTYVLLYRLFGAELSMLGIYLPVLVVEPVIVKRMEFPQLESVRDAWRHGFNNALGACLVILLVGCVRELLATGAVFGNPVLGSALLPLAAQPAGGFILVGVLAAVWLAAANAYTDYKREEVRRTHDRSSR